jgi:hypothetical protein
MLHHELPPSSHRTIAHNPVPSPIHQRRQEEKALVAMVVNLVCEEGERVEGKGGSGMLMRETSNETHHTHTPQKSSAIHTSTYPILTPCSVTPTATVSAASSLLAGRTRHAHVMAADAFDI